MWGRPPCTLPSSDEYATALSYVCRLSPRGWRSRCTFEIFFRCILGWVEGRGIQIVKSYIPSRCDVMKHSGHTVMLMFMVSFAGHFWCFVSFRPCFFSLLLARCILFVCFPFSSFRFASASDSVLFCPGYVYRVTTADPLEDQKRRDNQSSDFERFCCIPPPPAPLCSEAGRRGKQTTEQ